MSMKVGRAATPGGARRRGGALAATRVGAAGVERSMRLAWSSQLEPGVLAPSARLDFPEPITRASRGAAGAEVKVAVIDAQMLARVSAAKKARSSASKLAAACSRSARSPRTAASARSANGAA